MFASSSDKSNNSTVPKPGLAKLIVFPLGMKTLDDTNAYNPLVPLGRSSESEHLVDLNVSDVAGDHGMDRRDVKHGTRPDIALADFNHTQFVAFKGVDVFPDQQRVYERTASPAPKISVNVMGENVLLGLPAITRAGLANTRSSGEDR